MKGLTAVILMVFFSLQTCSNWLLVLEYEVNKDLIAKNLCVNKAKPQLHCNGKCQLAKSMAADENNKSPNTATVKFNGNPMFFKPDCAVLFSNAPLPVKHQPFYQLRIYNCDQAAVFHPPSV